PAKFIDQMEELLTNGLNVLLVDLLVDKVDNSDVADVLNFQAPVTCVGHESQPPGDKTGCQMLSIGEQPHRCASGGLTGESRAPALFSKAAQSSKAPAPTAVAEDHVPARLSSRASSRRSRRRRPAHRASPRPT